MPTRNPTFRNAGWKPAARNFQAYDATGFYHSPEWKADRAAVIARSKGRCERIEATGRCPNSGRTVNHIDHGMTGKRVPIDRLEHLCPTHDNREHREKGTFKR